MEKYTARPLASLEPSTDTWARIKIGVFHVANGVEKQIGEYERNYASFFETFFPFRWKEKDLALYSRDYTATRIMELPSCTDIGGEEPHESGFCPVEYLVPSFITQEMISDYGGSFEQTPHIPFK